MLLLQEMQGTVMRATALSNHMLSLAKVEQLRERADRESCDAYAVAREAAIELSPLVSAKELDFELSAVAGVDAKVLGHPWLIGELLRNLVALPRRVATWLSRLPNGRAKGS